MLSRKQQLDVENLNDPIVGSDIGTNGKGGRKGWSVAVAFVIHVDESWM